MAELNMETIVSLVQAHGVHAFVQQTGGGATIYAGATRTEAETETEYYAVAAGPGWFSGPRWSEARGDDEDFFVGPDNDGSAPNEAYTECKGMDEAAIAAEIVRRAATL
jgi:hypothetical protein